MRNVIIGAERFQVETERIQVAIALELPNLIDGASKLLACLRDRLVYARRVFLERFGEKDARIFDEKAVASGGERLRVRALVGAAQRVAALAQSRSLLVEMNERLAHADDRVSEPLNARHFVDDTRALCGHFRRAFGHFISLKSVFFFARVRSRENIFSAL